MILGVIMLAGVSLTARLAGMEAHDRELMNCMLTYSLLVSLSITSWFNMVTTRYVSDMLYEESWIRSCLLFTEAVLLCLWQEPFFTEFFFGFQECP